MTLAEKKTTAAVFVSVQFLKKNPLKRLGAGEKDANEVKEDKFFEVKNDTFVTLVPPQCVELKPEGPSWGVFTTC